MHTFFVEKSLSFSYYVFCWPILFVFNQFLIIAFTCISETNP